MSKENEKRERTKESKEKESNTLSLTPAGAHTHTREELQQIARSIPTVEQVISFAHTIIGFNDEHFIREWHRQMEMAFWCDEFGNPIRNWGWVFNKWRLNKKLFDRLRDPERIPDARKGGGGSPRKSDNWRGASRNRADGRDRQGPRRLGRVRRRSRRSGARRPTFCRSSGSSSRTATTGRNRYANSGQKSGHGKNNSSSRRSPLFSASKRTFASLQNRVFV